MPKTVDLIVTSAFMFQGDIVLKDDVIEDVPEREAIDYLRRGKAKLAPSQSAEVEESYRDQLEAMKVPELKTEAADLNIEGYATMNKVQLVDAIIEAADDGEGDDD